METMVKKTEGLQDPPWRFTLVKRPSKEGSWLGVLSTNHFNRAFPKVQS